jgi:hypothetical protein
MIGRMKERLATELEAALLRALRATWQELNEGHLRSRLQAPTIALHDDDGTLGRWAAETRTSSSPKRSVSRTRRRTVRRSARSASGWASTRAPPGCPLPPPTPATR